MNGYFCLMLYKSMQYAPKYALIAFIFCETLLISGVVKALPPRGKKKWVIVIDAGHGGKDPGCHGDKFKEKDVALSVALKFGNLLKENDDNVSVIYTRTTDVFIPLNERAEIANRNHADFFVCVHCNASRDKTAYGSATYVMGLYKSEGNLEVSKRENASVLYEKDYKQTYNGFDPNSPEGNVIFSMYQNLYLEQSLDLSSKIQNEYTNKAALTDNGVKQAGFLVLWKTAMPSLLTEIGFLTNPDEEKYIASQKGENKIAECLFFAMQQYMDEKDGVAFNTSNFKLDVPLPDSIRPDDTSVDVLDTTEKVVKADTTKVKPPKPPKPIKKTVSADTAKKPAIVNKPAPQKPINKIATADTTKPKPVIAKKPVPPEVNKMKESLKVLHTDSVKAKPPTYSDDTTKIVYKVQIATSSKLLSINDEKFKDVQDVEMYMDNAIYKYTTGHFSTLAEAVSLQSKIRENGFKDAFVVAFKGKNRVKIGK